MVFGAYRLFVQAAQGNLLSVPFDARYTITLLIVLLVGGVAVGAFGSFLVGSSPLSFPVLGLRVGTVRASRFVGPKSIQVSLAKLTSVDILRARGRTI